MVRRMEPPPLAVRSLQRLERGRHRGDQLDDAAITAGRGHDRDQAKVDCGRLNSDPDGLPVT
jgi:hypothetical protein